MNIFRNLMGRVWQDPNAAEVLKISTGQLYLVRPGNIRSSRECIYNEAMATIRRAPAAEHNFELVITRVYEEGDQELLEDDSETDEERTFLIGEELEFRTGQTDGEPTFIWRDLYGDIDELFEYVATGTNEPTKAFFETCMYRAMYERKYRVSADQLGDADLEEFIWRPPTVQKPPPRRKVARPPSGSSVEEVTSAVAMPEPEVPSSKGKAKAEPDIPVTSLGDPMIVSTEVELYYWVQDNEDGGQFSHQGVVTAHLVKRKVSGFHYALAASVDDNLILHHDMEPNMNPRWSPKLLSLTWNHVTNNEVNSWLFRFPSQELYHEWCAKFTQAAWETLHQVSWEKIKEDEQNYVMSSNNEDVEMLDAEDEEDDEDEVASELDPDAGESEEEEEDEDDQELPPSMKSGDKNSRLTVGYKGDRSYVVRGNNIGVFNHSDRDVKYYATISRIATPKGKEFKPKNVMLHDQDTKMILMNPSDPNSLYNMDIERGKVVEEWKVHDDIAVDHIAPDNKFAQTTPEQTLVGASHNALFRIDPRVSGIKMVDSQYKQYTGKNKFSGVTTTASGKLAVASEKGDIRLFDSIGKNAKTALPPLGDPILGIDTTADGRWIVATTKTYLLLIDTLIGEGRYAGSLGFDRSFPANAKPIPRRLQLRNEHVAYMNHDISLTPARFNMGEGQEENAIVTSTGQFVIAWDFAKVKKGLLDRYEIKKYEDHVVQDNFKFGDDKEIIVALSNNVLAVNKKNLVKPNRRSLGALMKKSDIVNTY
ncbi:VID27 cytoplasmic protein [Dendrothele bispora CBS 962.96]|uniref:VID27 cytoplasmic protein n=1 Tax=Dendrothele bispora (strain CBS 962.96) TaxID=1314807 RepID=A0A4S8MYG3_DENBC|nr:VID27 cytoplasmic protein [Dendrothele bispora CBS 962.96]